MGEGAGRERPLWKGHRERLRRRMEREGWDSLKPHEMVELVLYHAVPRQDLSDVSRLLVDRFGSVGGVFAASREQLLAVEGVTDTLAEWIGITGELMRAYSDLHAKGDIRLSCCREVMAFLRPRKDDAGDAAMWVIFADFEFNLITYADFPGDREWWDFSNIRRMMTEAIANGARYVYLVLWLGDMPLELAEGELDRLESIASTLRSADLDLVDCVLAGNGELRSMNVRGALKNLRADARWTELREQYVRGLN